MDGGKVGSISDVTVNCVHFQGEDKLAFEITFVTRKGKLERAGSRTEVSLGN